MKNKQKIINNLSVLIFSTLLFLTSCSANISSDSRLTPSPVFMDLTQNPGSTKVTENFTQTLATKTFESKSKTEITISTPTAKLILISNEWMELPAVPTSISQKTLEIYSFGREKRNNPYSFSVVGDCESSPSWFLGDFDKNQNHYDLGQYKYLETVINAFQGSFSRKSLAVGNGYNSASILSPFWSDPEFCEPGETPLDCEIRNHHPSFVFILLGTNDIYNIETFEINMRTIISTLIDEGIVPIVATKADNLEGNNKINEIISTLSYEYDIPLWNFWQAVQPLSNHGLQDDHAHLTWANNDFSNPASMDKAWPWRNLTALQILDLLLESVQ